jgi:hypothetical protein
MQPLNRKDYTMTEKSKSTPGRGQYLLAIVLGTLAIGAGGISLSMNAAFGMKTGLVMAAIFILSDGAKIILPMADAALGGSSAKRRLAYWTAVLISVLAATSYLLETQATRLIQSEKASETATSARTDAERIRGELAAISEKRSPDAIKAEIEAHKQHKRWTSTVECTDATVPESRDYCQAYNQLRADLATAERRERLDIQLAGTVEVVRAAPAEALGSADTLAALTGGNKAEIAQHEAIVKAILMLMILEIIAMFSGDAGNLFVRTWSGRRKLTKPARKQTKSSEAGRKADEISPEISKASYWMKRLAKEQPELARRVISGEISCYKACIQAGIRKAPETKTKSDWTKPEAYVKKTETVDA